MPEQGTYKPLTPFQLFVKSNFPFIEATFEGLDNYGLYCKIVEYLNNVIENENTVESNVTALYNAFVSLNNYVSNYFDNLDVQQEINHKLDVMTENGTLSRIIETYVNPAIEEMNSTLNSAISGQNAEISNIRDLVDNAVGTTPIVVSSTDEMTDTSKIYVNVTDGKWYYYTSGAWTIGGTYQSTGIGEDSIFLANINKKTLGNLFKLDGVKNFGSMYFQIANSSIQDITKIKYKALIYVKSTSSTAASTNLLVRSIQGYNPSDGSSIAQTYISPSPSINITDAMDGYIEVEHEETNLSNIKANAIEFRWNYYSVPSPLDIEWYVKNIRIWINDNEIQNIYMSSTYEGYLAQDISPAKDFLVSNSEYTQNNFEIQQQLSEANEALESVPTTLEQFMNQYDTTSKSNLHEITCFGDSLTEGGSAGKSYPTWLSEIINDENIHVNNLGKGGQCSGTISFRQGGNELSVVSAFNIPASNLEGVNITLAPSSGNARNFSNVNDNLSVTIDGIVGTLNINTTDPDLNTIAATFTRTYPGTLTSVSEGEKVISNQNDHDYDVNIIWMGLNDATFAEPYALTGVVANYTSMIEYLKPTIKRFLVVSPTTTAAMTSGTSGHTLITAINEALEELYPNNFVDIETYLCTQCIYDMGITPTETDIEKMEAGTIPPSITADGIHPNEQARYYIAKFIYNNMILKGWIL